MINVFEYMNCRFDLICPFVEWSDLTIDRICRVNLICTFDLSFPVYPSVFPHLSILLSPFTYRSSPSTHPPFPIYPSVFPNLPIVFPVLPILLSPITHRNFSIYPSVFPRLQIRLPHLPICLFPILLAGLHDVTCAIIANPKLHESWSLT